MLHWLTVGQVAFVLALVPALVAGAVAEERSRRSLDSLLVSPLSGLEIVIQKLAAKLLRLGLLLAVSLPIVCMLAMLGGTDAWTIAAAFGGISS
jgi:ABC-type transport system involved in multi-copper enzyme maturation permease subunit